MNHILVLITFGCCISRSLGDIQPSNSNITHYACNSICISKFSKDLTPCQSDTGISPDCTGKQLGEKLPEAACDYTKPLESSAEEINELLRGGRFVAFAWNTIRIAFTKGPLSFKYIAEGGDGTVSNIEVIADTESTRYQCQYNFEVVQDTSKSEPVRFFTINEGGSEEGNTNSKVTQWHWGWYFHSENVHIFRSCQSSPKRPENDPYGSIIVFIREGHKKEGNEAINKLPFLRDVKFDNSIVECV